MVVMVESGLNLGDSVCGCKRGMMFYFTTTSMDFFWENINFF